MSNAQSLLFKAYRRGVSVRLNGRGGLRLAPSLAARAFLPAVRACKPQLLALVTGLEQYGAQDDPLILEALALFNATVMPHRMPGQRATLPVDESGREEQAPTRPMARQAAFRFGAKGETPWQLRAAKVA
jgi:hypothetical protein